MPTRATVLVLLLLATWAGVDATAKEEAGHTVSGRVELDGEAPTPQEWKLDEAMRQATGETHYRDESWLVGPKQGLANCVITLKAKQSGRQVEIKPLKGIVLDKVGVRYVPHVLAVTPGTEVLLRNKESPCRGFYIEGLPNRNPVVNIMLLEGKEQQIKFEKPDYCKVSCPVRPYTRGHIVVVDTPWFAVTDASGAFTLRSVPPGEYRVALWHEAAGKKTQATGPKEVTVGGQKPVNLNYRVRPPG